MAVRNLTYKIKLVREVPVVKVIALKGEKGDPGSGGLIDVIKVNGTTLPVSNKTVDISVPTKTSDLTNDSNLLSSANIVGGVTEGNAQLATGGEVYTAVYAKLDKTAVSGGVASGNTGIATGGQVYTAIQNAINSITDGDSEEY